jgi:hypothetical protein
MAEEKPAGNKSAPKGPQTISVSPSGTHATGGYTQQNLRAGELPPIEKASRVWVEDPTQAKQENVRDHTTTGGVAAPDHPHVGPIEESAR